MTYIRISYSPGSVLRFFSVLFFGSVAIAFGGPRNTALPLKAPAIWSRSGAETTGTRGVGFQVLDFQEEKSATVSPGTPAISVAPLSASGHEKAYQNPGCGGSHFREIHIAAVYPKEHVRCFDEDSNSDWHVRGDLAFCSKTVIAPFSPIFTLFQRVVYFVRDNTIGTRIRPYPDPCSTSSVKPFEYLEPYFATPVLTGRCQIICRANEKYRHAVGVKDCLTGYIHMEASGYVYRTLFGLIHHAVNPRGTVVFQWDQAYYRYDQNGKLFPDGPHTARAAVYIEYTSKTITKVLRFPKKGYVSAAKQRELTGVLSYSAITRGKRWDPHEGRLTGWVEIRPQDGDAQDLFEKAYADWPCVYFENSF